MATNISEKDTKYKTIYKIKINEKLFKSFDNLNKICTKNIIVDGESNEPIDEDLFDKYNEFCMLELTTNNSNNKNIKYCTECFKKFIVEDLTFLEKENIKISE